MSYCVNPTCSSPKNSGSSQICEACGSQLILHCRFRPIKPLGQGGFGATFLAIEENLPGKPRCVIKQLRPVSKTPHPLKMAGELFAREAETLGRIGNHPQIPRLLDYFEHNQQFYLVQEYVSGLTLQQEVVKTGVYNEDRIWNFLRDIMPLLQYIHEQKVIHRDIKPANLIRRSQDSKLVLIDFGAVKNQVNQITSGESKSTALTAYAIGTSGFAPPEQMAMRPVYSSDIYAVGVTCIYLLTAKIPKDLEYNPTTGDITWEHLVNISDRLTTVLKKMLEMSVRDRYQTAQNVLQALDMKPYLDSLTQGLVSTPPISTPVPTEKNQDPGVHNYTSDKNNSITKIAESIRSRKEKTATELQRGYTQNGGSLSEQPPVSNRTHRSINNYRSPSVQKLDTKGLLVAYNTGERDFSCYNFTLLNVVRANLSGANFHSAQFHKANFQGTNLQNTDFGGSSLKEANFRDANLSKAYFSNADLEGADFRGADLSRAYMSQANLRGANLSGANLTGAKVTDQQLAVAKMNMFTVRPNGKRSLF
jgi:serine/threonine-protein kinase